MALQLILGSSGSGKSYQLYQEMINKSIQHPEVNYQIIVPEQFTMQTQKDIVSMHPNHGVMNIDILSFMRLAYRVFEEVGQKEQVVLEDTGKCMLLRRVVADKQKDLVLFQSNVRKQGFISELKSLMSEIFQYSVTEEQLNEMEKLASGRPMLQAKLRDITTIYRGFRDIIHEKYITAEEILDVLVDVVEESDLLRNSVICFDGFTGFTPSQYKLISRLLPVAKSVLVTITVDPREDVTRVDEEFKLFHLSKKTILKLTELAKEANVKVQPHLYAEKMSDTKVPYRFRESEALAALEHNLFRYPIRSYDKEQSDLTIHTAMDPAGEVNFCIREIKQLVRENHYRYKDIAIVTGDIETYGRIFRQEMTADGLPCFIDNKKDILSNPYVEFLRAAIEIVIRDYSYESMFRFLRCGLNEITTDEVDELENYVVALGIRGHGMWTKEWKYTYRSKMPIDLEHMNGIRAKVADCLEPMYLVLYEKGATVADYTRALYEFSIRQDVYTQLTEYAQYFESRNLPLLAKEYLQIYRIVMELFDKFVELLGDEVLPLAEYDKVLESGLTEAKVGLIPPGMDQIVIGDTTRTRLKDIKALFFVGVNDHVIPSSNPGGGILSDLDRELFADHDFEMAPTRRQNAYMEQFYLYLNLTKPQNRLYVTYCKLGSDGKACRPSYLIGKLQQLFPQIPIRDEQADHSLEKILGERGGVEYLIDGLRRFHEEEPDDVFKELYSYYFDSKEYKDMLKSLVEGAFYCNTDEGIGKYAASQLYGGELMGSVTRLERFASCAFAHFMQFGLRLNPRQEHKIEIPDIGNLFHLALSMFSEKLAESGYQWSTLPDDLREEWATYCVQIAIEQYGNTALKSSKRNEYLMKRVERIQKRTVWALSEQMKAGKFTQVESEQKFTHPLPRKLDQEFPMKLTGQIDRLDACILDDKLYLKVIDYKSGNLKFELPSLYYGLQMQLAVYLSVAIQMAQQQYKDKTVIPAGILYYHIDDPIIERTVDAQTELLKKLRMNGLVNSDMEIVKLFDKNFGEPDAPVAAKVKSMVVPVETNKDGFPKKTSSIATNVQFKAITDYVNHKMDAIGCEIMQGRSEVNPYKLGDKTACDYCDFSGICGFDTKVPGYRYRRLPSLDKEEAMEDILESLEQDEEEKNDGKNSENKETDSLSEALGQNKADKEEKKELVGDGKNESMKNIAEESVQNPVKREGDKA